MPKAPKKLKGTKGSMLLYSSGTNQATCIPKVYTGKIPKKDNPNDRYTIMTGYTKGVNFWFDAPLIFNDGSMLEYWPI